MASAENLNLLQTPKSEVFSGKKSLKVSKPIAFLQSKLVCNAKKMFHGISAAACDARRWLNVALMILSVSKHHSFDAQCDAKANGHFKVSENHAQTMTVHGMYQN